MEAGTQNSNAHQRSRLSLVFRNRLPIVFLKIGACYSGDRIMARVSIITATYNRSDVLRYAIESVLSQTYTDLEQIIVGDACADDTAEVVASFSDPRLSFVNRAANWGEQSVPNNDGFSLASGTLIAYLNQDDLWFPDHLGSLVSFIDQTGADLAYALPFKIDRHGMPTCDLTNAELRYDPTHFIVASLWLARR